MSNPTTTMRIDENVKKEAKPILEELGLNISSATNIFLKAVVRCGGMPFDLRLSENSQNSGTDFVADYLAPVMSSRNEIIRVGFNPTTFRRRLIRRAELINRGRRTVA